MIGNALEVVADDSGFDEIVQSATEKRYGRLRGMFVAALGNMKNPKAPEVLIDLLEDDEVAGYAVMALGKLRSADAEPRIERFLKHPDAWMRREAKKAMARINSSRL